jgi:hypothetical protein
VWDMAAKIDVWYNINGISCGLTLDDIYIAGFA